jgi:hypothetical protein
MTTQFIRDAFGSRNRLSRTGQTSVAEMQLGDHKAFRFEPVNGHQSVHLRRWAYDDETRGMRPTAAALMVDISQLPQLYSMIGAALAKARRDGLVITAADCAAPGGAR